MTLGCIFGHRFAYWHAIQEIPVWRTEDTLKPKAALGLQPSQHKLYSNGNGGLISKIEPDLGYVLAGKVIEQRRICQTCGYAQVNKQRWTV